MKDNLTEIVVVLDRSGSMAFVRQATISGFNEFVKGQKAASGEAVLSLIQFDSDNPYEVVMDRERIGEVPLLTTETYQPRSGTPLHDAIGRTILNFGGMLSNTPEANRPGKVVIVIVTDGYENSSREFDSAKIADMIAHQRAMYSWDFIFLGANQDAILTGEKLGMPLTNCSTFDPSAGGVRAAFTATSGSLAGYRSGSTDVFLYSQQQREAMANGNAAINTKVEE